MLKNHVSLKIFDLNDRQRIDTLWFFGWNDKRRMIVERCQKYQSDIELMLEKVVTALRRHKLTKWLNLLLLSSLLDGWLQIWGLATKSLGKFFSKDFYDNISQKARQFSQILKKNFHLALSFSRPWENVSRL